MSIGFWDDWWDLIFVSSCKHECLCWVFCNFIWIALYSISVIDIRNINLFITRHTLSSVLHCLRLGTVHCISYPDSRDTDFLSKHLVMGVSELQSSAVSRTGWLLNQGSIHHGDGKSIPLLNMRSNTAQQEIHNGSHPEAFTQWIQGSRLIMMLFLFFIFFFFCLCRGRFYSWVNNVNNL